MGKFKEFWKKFKLNESYEITEEDFAQNNSSNGLNGLGLKPDPKLDKLIDTDKEVQELIDEINADDDAEIELEESMLKEGTSSPFEEEGTMYDGETGEAIKSAPAADTGINEAEDEEMVTTDTFKFLNGLKKNPPTMDEIRSNFQLYRIANGKLQKRANKFFGGYQDMSDKDIADFIALTNERRTLKKTVYEVDTDGSMTKTVYAKNKETGEDEVKKPKTPIKSPMTMKRICNLLNKELKDQMGDKLFWFADKKTGKDKVLTISKGELSRNKNNDELHDFTNVEYEPMTDKNIAKLVGDKLTYSMNKKRIKDNSVLDYQNGKIMKDGTPMDDEQLKSFIHDRNGMPNPDDEYWDSFKFLKEGSKIGATVGSFSLPPGTSCLDGVPCAHQGCYAYKSFRNPTVRACWFANLGKLQEGTSKDGIDRFKQFEDECIKFIKDKKLTHFRFHVSGDVDIGPNKSKYIQSICKIASSLPDVQFWTYTKDYAAWDTASVPSNLVVILSAWGQFQPNAALADKHPVAFLYDVNDPKVMEILKRDHIDPAHFDEYQVNKDSPVVFCPCSDPTVKEEVHCDMCKICFTRTAHHNVAFHKH